MVEYLLELYTIVFIVYRNSSVSTVHLILVSECKDESILIIFIYVIVGELELLLILLYFTARNNILKIFRLILRQFRYFYTV